MMSYSPGYATERDYSAEKVLIHKHEIEKKRESLLSAIKNLKGQTEGILQPGKT